MNGILNARQEQLFTAYIKISLQKIPLEQREKVFNRMIILEDAKRTFLEDVSSAIESVHEPFKSAVIKYFGLQGSDQYTLNEISAESSISRYRALHLIKHGCYKLFDFIFLSTKDLPTFIPKIREETDALFNEE